MTAPAYKHPELRSLSEAQSEHDNGCPECGGELEYVSGQFDTGVVAPDGYRESAHESGYYCPRCNYVYDEADLERPEKCKHGTTDDAECDLRDVAKCIRLEREREDGIDDPYYGTGRGMPRG